MVLVLLADSIRLTEEQKMRISEMIIICIEGNAEAATKAAATVRGDHRMKGRVHIIAGLSTTPDVIVQVRNFIEPVANAIVVGPVCELLGSLATVEGYEYIVRDLAQSFPCISSIPGPDRYATVSVIALVNCSLRTNCSLRARSCTLPACKHMIFRDNGEFSREKMCSLTPLAGFALFRN